MIGHEHTPLNRILEELDDINYKLIGWFKASQDLPTNWERHQVNELILRLDFIYNHVKNKQNEWREKGIVKD